LQIEDMYTENIKNNSIGKVIETDTCTYMDGFKRRYHAISRDWISNEIFRRVEPAGRTMGEYLREEINPLLGTQIILGANEEE
jgi:polyphosphate kinase